MVWQLDGDLEQVTCIGIVMIVGVLVSFIVTVSIDSIGAVREIGRELFGFCLVSGFCVG